MFHRYCSRYTRVAIRSGIPRSPGLLEAPGTVRALVGALLLVWFAVPVLAQSPQESPEAVVPLSRYVPDDVEYFLRIPRLGDTNAALQRSGALPWFGLLDESADGAEPRMGLTEIVSDFLGSNSSIDAREIMNCEIGIVSEGWSGLSSAVWLVRVKDLSVLDRWVPKEARRHDLRSRTGTRYIWTQDGMTLCIRGNVVALARRTAGGGLLKGVRGLMNGRGAGSLETSEAFQKLGERLPARYLALLHAGRADKRALSDGALSLFWPAIERAAVALYERHGQLVLALSGELSAPRRQTAVSAEAIERLARLPRTTLLAAATTFDFAQAYRTALDAPEPGIFGRYLALMEGIGSRRSAAVELFQGIGPNAVLVWAQNLRGDARVPSLGVMLECKDARSVRAEFTYMVASILKMLGAIDPVKRSSAPQVNLEVHLGCPIVSVPLADYAGESRFQLSQMLSGAEPSWAAWGNWFVVALDRDLIKRILDAQNGLIPTLDTIRDVQMLTRSRETRMTLGVIQAGLAADVLGGWLQQGQGSFLPLLDSLRGPHREPTAPNSLERFGVVIRTDESLRLPRVAQVLPQSPAEGRLQPDDLIVGVDGSLIELQSPVVDLRRKLSRRSAQTGPLFRVQRGDSVIDVEFPVAESGTGLSGLLVHPADSLRELAALGAALQFVTVETRLPDETQMLARISLKFTDSDQARR